MNETKAFDLKFINLINKKNITNIVKLFPHSYSQLRQDIFVLNETNFKKRGFFIEFATDGKPVVKPAEKIPDLSELLASADFSRGEKIFKKCASCHNINQGEGAKVGPNLYAVIGRKKGSMAGFSYSEALIAKGGVWNSEEVNQFITKPKNYIAGTKMAFAGLKKPQDRADVILYLQKKSTN